MKKEKYKKFFVGVNVLILSNRGLLLGKRKNAVAAGSWGLPGGHLETNEKLEQCASRELYEETGLRCEKFEFLNVVNQPQKKNGHYFQFLFLAKNWKGKPKVKEPNKCEEWKWFQLDRLPRNITYAHKKSIEIFKKGKPFANDNLL